MSTSGNGDALGFTRGILKILTVVNIVFGVAIAVLLAISIASPDWFFPAIGLKRDDGWRGGMRMIMIGGIIGVPLTHLVLQRIRAIVETVRDGDPFVAVNADRLRGIAWLVLALLLLQRGIASVALRIAELDLDLRFSVAPWLAVLLLFVLARVFEQGARMRADLEGTV